MGKLASVKIDKPKETIDAWQFNVTIDGSAHEVEVEKKYWRILTDERINARELVFRSILYLLERESAENILPSFNLKEISEYFPKYEQDLKISIAL